VIPEEVNPEIIVTPTNNDKAGPLSIFAVIVAFIIIGSACVVF